MVHTLLHPGSHDLEPLALQASEITPVCQHSLSSFCSKDSSAQGRHGTRANSSITNLQINAKQPQQALELPQHLVVNDARRTFTRNPTEVDLWHPSPPFLYLSHTLGSLQQGCSLLILLRRLQGSGKKWSHLSWLFLQSQTLPSCLWLAFPLFRSFISCTLKTSPYTFLFLQNTVI